MSEAPDQRLDFEPAPSQVEVDDWWRRQRCRFPAGWEDERNKVALCRDIGDSRQAPSCYGRNCRKRSP